MPAATPWIGSASDHYENFPVASWLLPATARAPIGAVYRFARYADDVADEGEVPDEQRLAELQRLRASVLALEDGTAEHPVVIGLARYVPAAGIRQEWLLDLLSAFAQDVTVKRHASRASLMDYCRRSADPVGRIVLSVFGRLDGRTQPLSDAICSALQLINFLQDFARDWRSGRLYVPLDELSAAGLDEAAVDAAVRRGVAGPQLAALIARQAEFARALLESGRPLIRLVPLRLSLELRAVVAGGARVLAKLAAGGHDPIAERPKLGGRDIVPALWAAIR